MAGTGQLQARRPSRQTPAAVLRAALHRGGKQGTRAVPSPWAAGTPSGDCAGVSVSLSLHSLVSNVLSSSEISSTFRLVSAEGMEGQRGPASPPCRGPTAHLVGGVSP